MKKTITALLLGLILSTANAYEFNIDDKTQAQINGKIFAFFSSTKDSFGTNSSDLSGGGEASEIEFKLNKKISYDVSTFFEIELAAKPLQDSNNVYFDDIRIGFKSKKYGKFTITKNTDDPFEAEVVEILVENDILTIDEPENSSSSDNQVQYESPKIANFNIVLGLSKKYDEAGKVKRSIAVKYSQKQYGFAIGANENTNNDSGKFISQGFSTWYEINNTKIYALYANTEVGVNTNKKYTGFGILYNAGFANINLNTQNIKETNTDDKRQLFLGIDKKIFTNVNIYAQLLKLDNENNEGNSNGLGIKFSF